MEFLSNVTIFVFVIGCFVVLSAGIYISTKLTPVQNTETAPVVEDDPFEVEIEWAPNIRRNYILNRIPGV